MTVEQLITALIGLPRYAEVEIADDNGTAAQLLAITSSVYNGTTYVSGTIDRAIEVQQ